VVIKFLGEYVPSYDQQEVAWLTLLQTGLDILPWAVSYSTRNFTRPNEFLPDRWLEKEGPGQQFDKRRHGAFQPFSVGARNCIGKKYG
jgi:cytochrome P450